MAETVLALGDGAGGGEEGGGAEAELAGAQVGLLGGGGAFGGGKGPGRRAFEAREGFAVALAEEPDDFLDLDDLLGGGAEEAGEGFPGVLAQDAKARAGGDGVAQGRVVGEGGQHGREVLVDAEVTLDGGPVGDGRGGAGLDAWAVTPEPERVAAHDARPSVAVGFPSEGLAAVEGGGEVVGLDGPCPGGVVVDGEGGHAGHGPPCGRRG